MVGREQVRRKEEMAAACHMVLLPEAIATCPKSVGYCIASPEYITYLASIYQETSGITWQAEKPDHCLLMDSCLLLILLLCLSCRGKKNGFLELLGDFAKPPLICAIQGSLSTNALQ